MNPPAIAPPVARTLDADQAEQARPGYGIPSQDPRPGAQMPLRPEEAEREALSPLGGGGVVAGALGGAIATTKSDPESPDDTVPAAG